MKTKIIYISGSEVFDVTDIRAAFNEVRSALGLASDTVLFGVPVDADDAGLQPVTAEKQTETMVVTEPEEDIIEPEIVIEEKPAPIKKTAKKVKAVATEEIKEEIAQEEPAKSEEEKIIPILSILSAKADTPEQAEEPVMENIESVDDKEDDDDIEPEEDILEDTEVTEEIEITSIQTKSIEEMMADEVPEAETEKTLEQLLESMAPLREDRNHEEPEEIEEDTGIDATLEQLAAEFVEKQDEIEVAPKAENAGKIGKLKNILPFKKAKREEPSLMGDLFGWAGIAANDDDFSIPGFFTTTASKK